MISKQLLAETGQVECKKREKTDLKKLSGIDKQYLKNGEKKSCKGPKYDLRDAADPPVDPSKSTMKP